MMQINSGDAVAEEALPGAELGNGYFTKVTASWASLTVLVPTEPRNRSALEVWRPTS